LVASPQADRGLVPRMKQESSDLARVLTYVAPYWRRLVLVVALSLIGTVLSLFIPYLSKLLVDVALLGRDVGALFRIVGGFVGITVLSFFMNVTSGMRYTRVSADILFDMRRTLYEHLQTLSPRFYAQTSLGEIVSRINSDIGEIQRIASETALAWIGNVLFLVGTVALLLWLDARLFLVSMIMVPPSLWALVRYRRKLEVSVGTLRQRSADIGTFLIETIQGMKLVVSSNAQAREVDRFGTKNDTFIDALMSMRWLSYLAGGLPGLILSAGTAIVFLFGGSRVIAGTITLGTFVAFMAYQMRLLSPVQGLMNLWANFATAKVSLRRVYEILDSEPEVKDREQPIRLVSVRGALSFEDVSFSFERGGPVLDEVNFRVERGDVLAIVGPSGSGKSTVADLLTRHFDPDRGSIRLDGHDLRDVSLSDLRRHIASVDQDAFVFNVSVAENIRYADPSASPQAVAAAAAAAGLEDFLEGLPDGLDTPVGERGLAISAGERQRISVARALLTDPKVLVLDEATGSLDPVARERVTEGYEAVMRNRTTILITHRLELARRADRVLVISGTRMVEEGSPADLIRARGAFYRLFQRDIEASGVDHVEAQA
jgi:ATP-binding cassette subfamily B protein